MKNPLIDFFRPYTEEGINEQVDRKFRKYQLSFFISATIGYGLYYVSRLSLNVIKKPLVDGGILTEQELGIVGSALFFSYAIGKFVNGFLADRVNIQRFMATGLLVSALVNIVLGVSSSFWVFLILWGVNGFVQSMGAPSCASGLTRWFSDSNRGTYYGVWSASHNIGEALTFIGTAFLVNIAGWRWGMIGAGVTGLLGVVLILLFYHEAPGKIGYKSFISGGEKKKSVNLAQKEVLTNPYVWILAISSAFMYISRYAINSWGIFFLENQKGYTTVTASSLIAVAAICGIIGTVLSGFISDKFFEGSRNIPALIFGIGNALAIALFLYVPAGYIIIDIISMILFGLSIGVLICFLGGLWAIDLVSKKAAGAALGVVGIASYVGAGLQDIVSGFLIGDGKTINQEEVVSYDFTLLSYFWTGAAILSFMLCLLLWKGKK